MTLSALLVCQDDAAAGVLHRVLEELRIGVEVCPDFPRAGIRLAQDRFDLVVVDGVSNNDVIKLLREVRSSQLNGATLAVAVVSGQDSIRQLFSVGVNFVLYKPVAHDRALSSLRAARAVMLKDKRKSARTAVYAHVSVDYPNVEREQATLIDLARDGMAVRFGSKLPPTSKVYFQFKLPGQTSAVRLSGLLMWQDWNGVGGVQFVDVPKTSRRQLDEYLDKNLPKSSGRELPSVTVEIEPPQQQFKNYSVGDQTHERESSHEVPEPVREAATSPAEVASSDSIQNERRIQARHACRLSAEVYRTGHSVPNHCTLTDLSSGGCYLEVHLPFPQGSSIEIVVRTHDLKLHLRGTVQTSHPGYGMGVLFELKTKEEQINVGKLAEWVTVLAAKN